MFTYPIYDVDIVRSVVTAELGWPEPGEAVDESGLGCNRSYSDLRRLSWGEARKVWALETDLIARIESAIESSEELEILEEEISEDLDDLYGLDLGIASTVIALSAARCIPFSSCNAGSFGGGHHERYPLVAFYAPACVVELLIASAAEADIGLESYSYGYLVAYAEDIRKMRHFAQSLSSRSALFRAIRTPRPPRPQRPKSATNAAQYDLPFY